MQDQTQSKTIRIVRVDVKKLDKTEFYVGRKGTYCDLLLYQNQKPNVYGYDGFVVQSISKEQRNAGKRGPIVGNWREHSKAKNEQNGENEGNDDDIPF